MSVTGLNGHITLGIKMPIWLIISIGIAGLIFVFLNISRVTELPKVALIEPLGISCIYVLLGIGVGIFSNDASPSIGGFLAFSGLAIGFWNLFSPPSNVEQE